MIVDDIITHLEHLAPTAYAERFDNVGLIVGNKNTELTGVLVTLDTLEEVIDEAYCLKMEEDNIKSHSEGTSNQQQFEAKTKHIQQYRDQMKAENIAYISNYSLQYVAHNPIVTE